MFFNAAFSAGIYFGGRDNTIITGNVVNRITGGPFWNRGYAVKLVIGSGKLESFEIVPHIYDEEAGVLKLMGGEEKQSFMAKLEKLNNILKDDRLCDRYYTAASRKYLSMYESRMYEDHFYHYSVMGTEEHVDVLQCAGRERAIGELVEIPADIEEFSK